MIRTALTAALLLGAATPAMAQNGPPPSPFVSLEDAPSCSRAELKATTTAYVEAQRSGSLSALPMHDKAQYLENMETIEAKDGLWNTALPIAHSQSFHDEKRCKTFTEVIVTEGDHSYVLGTRLYMHDGQIIRIDSLVTDEGDWLYNANAFLKFTTQENWNPLHEYQRTPPSEMMRGANVYLDSFSDKFVEQPWGTPCARLEGGAYTNADNDPEASCEVGIPAGVLYIVNRDFLIDEEMGVINVYCRFGSSTGMPDSHTFRFIDGKYRLIHTLSVNMGDIPSPQATDDGGIAGGAPDPNAT